MIPWRDNLKIRGFPFITYALLLVNIRVFLLELGLGPRLEPFLDRYGLVPAVWTDPALGRSLDLADKAAAFLTSMFLHGGWLHLASNLWCLALFGRSVEGKVGHLRYLGLYLQAGIAAGVLQTAAHWGSRVPTIGASGAIAGVMGAYLMLFPKARIEALVPIFFLPWFVEISAFVYLGLWFLAQLYSGVLGLGGRFDAVAWWAHIGGFAAGAYLSARR